MSLDVVGAAALELLWYTATALAGAGIDVPKRQLVTHGPSVFDCGEDGGQLAVWWDPITSSYRPTAPIGPGDPDLHRLIPGVPVVTFWVELTRCLEAPTLIGDDRSVPTAHDLTRQAVDLAADAWAIYHVLRDVRAPRFGGLTSTCDVVQNGEVNPVPPLGGIGGCLTSIAVQLEHSLTTP